jgi:hypothetical protein
MFEASRIAGLGPDCGVVDIDQQKAEKQLDALPRRKSLRGIHAATSIEPTA